MILEFLIMILCLSGVALIYKLLKEKPEKWLFLKLIGYYILGLAFFRFSFGVGNNYVHLFFPLGFIFSLIFFHPTLNKEAKRYSSYLGFAIFVLDYYILPFFL